jgi:hypothetical protein
MVLTIRICIYGFRLSEQTAIISLHNIGQFIFVMVTRYVVFEAETEPLNTTDKNLCFKGLKQNQFQ